MINLPSKKRKVYSNLFQNSKYKIIEHYDKSDPNTLLNSGRVEIKELKKDIFIMFLNDFFYILKDNFINNAKLYIGGIIDIYIINNNLIFIQKKEKLIIITLNDVYQLQSKIYFNNILFLFQLNHNTIIALENYINDLKMLIYLKINIKKWYNN